MQASIAGFLDTAGDELLGGKKQLYSSEKLWKVT
jgi:hypothetical protein